MLSTHSRGEVKKILNVLDSLIFDLKTLSKVPKHLTNMPPIILEGLDTKSKQGLSHFFDSERKILLSSPYNSNPPKEFTFPSNENSKKQENDSSDEEDSVSPRSSKKNISAVPAIRQYMQQCKRQASNLRKIPNYHKNMDAEKKKKKKKSEEPQNMINKFILTMQEYRSLLKENMSLASDEYNSNMRQKKKLLFETKKADADIKLFKSALFFEQQMRTNTNKDLEVKIKKLENAKVGVNRKRSRERDEYVETLAEEMEFNDESFRRSRKKYSALVNGMRMKIRKLRSENFLIERKLKENRRSYEWKVQGNIDQYKEMMTSSTKKLEKYIRKFRKDEKRIDFLTENLDKMTKKKNEIEEKNRIKTENLSMNLGKMQTLCFAKLLLMQTYSRYKSKKKRRRRKSEWGF